MKNQTEPFMSRNISDGLVFSLFRLVVLLRAGGRSQHSPGKLEIRSSPRASSPPVPTGTVKTSAGDPDPAPEPTGTVNASVRDLDPEPDPDPDPHVFGPPGSLGKSFFWFLKVTEGRSRIWSLIRIRIH
jgi:hypothetical protein